MSSLACTGPSTLHLEPHCELPVMKIANLFPSSVSCLFNIPHPYREPFLLSYGNLVLVGAFGEGPCRKLFRN